MQLFFYQELENGECFLNAEETRHCKVLRKNLGDQIQCIDGKGDLILAEIVALKKESTLLKTINKQRFEKTRPNSIHLIISPTKNSERIEWMLEKCVEIGLDKLTFIETQHSEKHRINVDRLKKIAISALKQSAQYHLPEIVELQPLAKLELQGLSLLAHCRDGKKHSLTATLNQKGKTKNINVLVGPEGDFSEEEIEALLADNCIPISLGNTRLRTETAGLYAIAVINSWMSGDE
jgi:16S rRNA (uracil1498-N3)-methyltransferase